MTDRKPVLKDIVEQMAIRSLVVQISTVRVQLTAIRAVLRNMDFVDGKPLAPDEVIVHPWIASSTQDHLKKAIELAEMSAVDLVKKGQKIVDREIKIAGRVLEGVSREEAIEILSDMSTNLIPGASDQKDQPVITEDHLNKIDLELADTDRMVSVRQVIEGDELIEVGGLLRVFMRCVWLTGMRPVELWSCHLFVPNPQIIMRDQHRDLIRSNPRAAIMEGMMVPVDHAMRHDGETNPGEAAMAAQIRSNAPCVLAIRSAKQGNVVMADTDVRVQILDGASKEDLLTIGLASMLGKAAIDDKRKSNLLRAMNRHLKVAVKRIPVINHPKINIYSFRHTFSTRVKLIHDEAAAAALTGHTSRKTLYGYGRRRQTSRTGGAVIDGWAPQPDPVRVEELRSYWMQTDPEFAPKPDRDPE